jgi:hypothetical protein
MVVGIVVLLGERMERRELHDKTILTRWNIQKGQKGQNLRLFYKFPREEK